MGGDPHLRRWPRLRCSPCLGLTAWVIFFIFFFYFTIWQNFISKYLRNEHHTGSAGGHPLRYVGPRHVAGHKLDVFGISTRGQLYILLQKNTFVFFLSVKGIIHSSESAIIYK